MAAAPQLACLEGVLDDARECLRTRGFARIEGVLDPGHAAELAHYLPTLSLAPRQVLEQGDLSWACEVGVPPRYDPQHTDCLHRLVRVMDERIPAIASTVSERALAPVMARRIHVWAFRRGAHVDQGKPFSPEGGVDVILGLTGQQWPAGWGGHLEIDGETMPFSAGALHLIRREFRVPLVTHHVTALTVRSVLGPA